MYINVNGVSTYYDIHTSEIMNNYWMDITKKILEDGQLIESVEIDGVDCQGDYFELLTNQFNHIESVNIKTISMEESFYHTLDDLNLYAIKVLEIMSDYITPLYSSTIEECGELPTIVESLEWVITSTNYLQYLTKNSTFAADKNSLINETVDKYNVLLGMLTSELEWGNLIGFADIVQYEFIPTLKRFYDATKEVEYPERNVLQ